jgi:hypothetical protein
MRQSVTSADGGAAARGQRPRVNHSAIRSKTSSSTSGWPASATVCLIACRSRVSPMKEMVTVVPQVRARLDLVAVGDVVA